MMMMWPTVSLLGFLVLTALVIAMGIQSTKRYEQEQRAEGGGARQAAAEALTAVSA